MNIGKALLLAVIIAATGLVVLPNTVSLFAGQHYWYNLSYSKTVPCQKCHADVFEELNLSNFHIHWGDPTRADAQDCAACHRSNLSITYANVTGSYTQVVPGKQAHAASVVACMLCHQLNASKATWAPGPFAGGFNISGFSGVNSPYNYSNATYNGKLAAHNAFIAMAIKNNTLPDSTEACVACHTHVAVKITWHHKRSLEFNVTIENPATLPNGVHNWNITDWTINGTATAISWGNTSGVGNTSYWSGWPGNVSGIYS